MATAPLSHVVVGEGKAGTGKGTALSQVPEPCWHKELGQQH